MRVQEMLVGASSLRHTDDTESRSDLVSPPDPPLSTPTITGTTTVKMIPTNDGITIEEIGARFERSHDLV